MRKGKDNGNRSKQGSDGRRVGNMNRRKFTKTNSSRQQREMKEAIDSEIQASKRNAYSWYDHFPQFTKDAGTLAFGIPVGQPIHRATDVVTIPGIMSLRYVPTIGYSYDNNSPINRATIRLYSHIRNIQKAAAKYDPADLMMYLMALDSCYSYWAFLRRIYGTAQLYTPVNKYYPRNILQVQGVSNDIANNLAQLRAYINKFAISLGSYAIPADFDITTRHMWMNEGLYVDSETTRAQTYLFVPRGFYKFDNTVTTGSKLTFVEWIGTGGATPKQLTDIINFGEALISAIRGDEDTGMISGDLYSLSVNGNLKLRKLEETTEGFMIVPSYNRVVLSQIENASIMPVDINSLVITQDPSVNNGAIKQTVRGEYGDRFTVSGSRLDVYGPDMGKYGTFVNMHVDSPTAEEVIEATRLKVMGGGVEVDTDGDPNTELRASGADIVTSMHISLTTGADASSTLHIRNALFCMDAIPDGSSQAKQIEPLVLIQNFDWHPLVYCYKRPQLGVEVLDVTHIGGDTDNLTLVSYEQLSMMHEASMLSLFDIPQMGGF